MKYELQSVARLYFFGALTIFALQLVFGLAGALLYVMPTLIPTDILPFSVARMIHTNALIVWLLMGFFGATFYLLPEECERELHSPLLAKIQFWLFFVAAVIAVVGYLFGQYDGRSYLEQPLYIKLGIVVVCVLFLFNCSMTVLKGRRTVISNILMVGLWGCVVFFLFAFYLPANVVIDKMFWWWVVHLWVEGVWELIMASDPGVPAHQARRASTARSSRSGSTSSSALALFSGILGTGHHYLLDRRAWLLAVDRLGLLGVEPLPFFMMVIFAFGMVWKGRRDHPNKAALLWSLGTAVTAFFGAGVWGFLHTLSAVNYYTHGTQLTAAHGHLSFYGAYAMVNIAMITYALPPLLKREPYNQMLNIVSFWLMTGGVVTMTAGVDDRGPVADTSAICRRPGIHGRAAAAHHVLLDASGRRRSDARRSRRASRRAPRPSRRGRSVPALAPAPAE